MFNSICYLGCFGKGAGPLKTRQGTLTVNTASFITYGQVYEFLLILSKGNRRAKAKIEVEMLSIPAPIVAIECVSLCFPTFGGVFVNPSSRLALRGTCLEECDGDELYTWQLERTEDDLNQHKIVDV